MDSLLIGLPFVAGLLGGLHCLGMCGPIVCAFGASCGPDKKLEFHFGYQSGRLISYLFLGGIFGVLGSILEQSLALVQLQSAAALFGAVVMILLALSQLTGLGFGFGGLQGGVAQNFGEITAKLKHLGGINWLLLGIMTGLLPCGLLFSLEALAMSTGTWFAGMVVMGAFWAGSLPYLVIAGELSNRLSAKFRKKGQAMLAVVMLAGGLAILYHRWTLLQWRATCTANEFLDPVAGLHWFTF